ncbi:cellulose synthase (UDP-forming), partial [Sarracenia purpurea var. burkii]
DVTMESEVESGEMSLKNLGGQVCQVCGDNVGMTVDGEPFIACDVCAFPEGDTDVGANEFRYSSENQNEKQKVTERMVSWHLTYGRGEDIGVPNYDKEISHNHIPLLTNGQEVSRELSPASLECLSMASLEHGGGAKRVAHVY